MQLLCIDLSLKDIVNNTIRIPIIPTRTHFSAVRMKNEEGAPAENAFPDSRHKI